MTKKDRHILDLILRYIGSNSQIEDEIACEIERNTNGKTTQEDFHNWIATVEI